MFEKIKTKLTEIKGMKGIQLDEKDILEIIEEQVHKGVINENEIDNIKVLANKINWRERVKEYESKEKNFYLLHSTNYNGKNYNFNDMKGFVSLNRLGLPDNFYGGNVYKIGKCDMTEEHNVFLLVEFGNVVFDIIKFYRNPLKEIVFEEESKEEIKQSFLDKHHKGGGYYEYKGETIRGKESFIRYLIETGDYKKGGELNA